MEWFGIEFHLVDGRTGEVIHCAFDQAARDWDLRGQLCRAVAAKQQAEIIEEEGPLVVLAIPVRTSNKQHLVAVGTFVTSHKATGPQLRMAAEMLGLEPEDAASWIARQTHWAPDALLRMGRMAPERLGAEQRVRKLEREVDDLSLHLSTSYEEISLLYRLTQNLKLSSNNEELADDGLAVAVRRAAGRIAGVAVGLEGLSHRGRRGQRRADFHDPRSVSRSFRKISSG